jgi:transcriptional regulator with XRE-family HTH domain
MAAGDFGQLLRRWRVARRRSQESLALESAVSPRHISFLETGRSRPSREMVLNLARELDLPLSDRNELLLAAGFAPLYQARTLKDPEMGAVRDSLRYVLAAQDPYPAVVVDKNWNRLMANEGSRLFMEDVAPLLLHEPINVLRLTLHPEGMAPRIRNLAEWSQHLLYRLHRQIARTGDAGLIALKNELAGYPGVVDRPPLGDDPRHRVALPLEYETEHGVLRLLSTSALFGAPYDVSLSELAIESFYPVDEPTKAALFAMTDATIGAVRGNAPSTGGHGSVAP